MALADRALPSQTALGGKRVLVVGLARQGLALARFLLDQGADITVTDRRNREQLTEQLASMEGLPVKYVFGEHPLRLLDGTDLLLLSGGVPPTIPLALEAQRRGIIIENDAQLTLRHCSAPIIGVSGSSGKTTTTTLIGLILDAAGLTAEVGGNIGSPLIDRLEGVEPEDWVVMELSSFQLELMTDSPPYALVTNVTPNHLDRHGTMEAYVAAKANILRWQRPEHTCVLGADDKTTGRWLRWGWVDLERTNGRQSESWPIRSHRVGFGLRSTLGDGAFLEGGNLVLQLDGEQRRTICPVDSVRMRGQHNVLNVLAACAMSGLVGAPTSAMTEVVSTFPGVPHRLEPVQMRQGVLWVNDSIATSPERSIAAMRSYSEPIILLAGGRDKKLPWTQWAELVRCKAHYVIAFGEAASLIEEVLREASSSRIGQRDVIGSPTVVACADLEQAVTEANVRAMPGDVVLLAPGGTSYDAYRDFEERGQHFRDLVGSLGD